MKFKILIFFVNIIKNYVASKQYLFKINIITNILTTFTKNYI